VSSNIIYYHT